MRAVWWKLHRPNNYLKIPSIPIRRGSWILFLGFTTKADACVASTAIRRICVYRRLDAAFILVAKMRWTFAKSSDPRALISERGKKVHVI